MNSYVFIIFWGNVYFELHIQSIISLIWFYLKYLVHIDKIDEKEIQKRDVKLIYKTSRQVYGNGIFDMSGFLQLCEMTS